MMSEKELIDYIKQHGGIILLDSLGMQELLNVEKKTDRLYYLRWSPRENSGESRKYVTITNAIELIKKHKPDLPL